ncbi:glutathione S-transferase C-terminal domain-containing protein [Streptomyces sp. NPDC057682]|uniref:glutathione S-transferase C-terminal domain-containing protein n=1 Tax=unclassified Streptomyces TaxID=2593676 RepID=UPI0036515A10
MPETVPRGLGTTGTPPRTPAPTISPARALGLRPPSGIPSPRFHSRIGVGLAGGFYPAPHRYELFLSAGCPRSLRVSITLDLLGPDQNVTTTLLTHPAASPDGFASLRAAYEATVHHYDGPLTVPALRDRWSGRIVSNHTPDILRDLAELVSGQGADRPGTLTPSALAPDIEALRELLELGLAEAGGRAAVLGALERRLPLRPYALGDALTAADVDLWTALVQPGASGAPGAYPRLQAYVRRLGGHPAFRRAYGALLAAA